MDGMARVVGHVRLVGDHDDGQSLAAIELGQEAHQLMAARGVEVAGRFIGEQHARLGGDGARDRDALLLTAGQFIGRMMGAIGEPDGGQRRERALRAASARAGRDR